MSARTGFTGGVGSSAANGQEGLASYPMIAGSVLLFPVGSCVADTRQTDGRQVPLVEESGPES